MRFHINPSTGIALQCLDSTCLITDELHYVSQESAVAAFEAIQATKLYEQNYDLDIEFDKKLEAAVQGGFAKASKGYPIYYDAQISVILSERALSYIGDRFCLATNQYMKSRYGKVLAWAVRQLAQPGEPIQKAYRRILEEHLRTDAGRQKIQEYLTGPEATSDDLLTVSASLWVYRGTPFHDRAKRLLFVDEATVIGYTPKTEKIFEEYNNADVAYEMCIEPDDLPNGVIAYDIETDTSNGFGLRPTRSQITEIVLSTREKSWVIGGDEKYILETFTWVLNEQKKNMKLASWNGQTFDNIALQTRAEYHKIKGWNGVLTPTVNYTIFEPVGPTGDPQNLTWTTFNDSQLLDVDIFQEKTSIDRLRGLRYTCGLKPFVESLGCNPIVVDRSRLHELTSEERKNYVLSDGLSTLRAFTELERLKLEMDYLQGIHCGSC